MSEPLRVLQVEDSESDAAMVVRALRKADYQVEAERVETAAEMRAALARESFHVILADYQLPQFDAPGALGVLQESGQDLPFIVVSGQIGEEAAVAMMKAGAHDYMMKDHLTRLAPAVERELREAQGRRDRRAAEQALRESEERFRTFFLEAPIGVALAAADGRLIDVNLAFCRMLGYGREELLHRSIADITHPDDGRSLSAEFEAMVQGGSSGYRVERRYLRKDGAVLWVSTTAAPIRDAQGRFLYGLGMIEDIGARRQAEAALRDSEARFSTVFHASPQSIALTRLEDNTVVDVNQAWSALTGWSREEIVGHTTLERNIWAEPAERDRLVRMLREQGTVRGFELHMRAKSGATSDVLMAAAQVEVAGQAYLLTMAADISDRKRAEQALRDSEERFRGVFQGVTDGILLADIETRAFVMANPALCQMLGYSEQEILALGVKDIHPPEQIAAISEIFRRQVAGDQRLAPRVLVQRKDGSTFVADISAVPVVLGGRRCLLGVFRDMTAFDALEQQMRQAQKMEAIGQLAGGVAHDFNNILAVILGYSEIVQRRLTTTGAQHGRIAQIHQAAERGASLTRQLLAFSRKQVLEPRVLELNDLVREMVPMLRRLIGEDVELVTSLGDGLGQVLADEGQMQQVLMNLAVNARDAMPRGGTLTIGTTHGRLEAGPAGPDPETRPGDYVVLTVRDSGHGMDAATLSRLFEPFFTTKEPGKGTGLGLATVHGVVKQSGGYVKVESEPGAGASFRVYLPMIEGRVEPRRPEAPLGALVGGSETILLLEDDAPLRSLEQEVLEGAGYRVIVAARPEEALSVVDDSPDRIDLLLSDVIMPGMSGPEVAAKLLERRPELRVLYVSGYAADAVARRGISETGARLLDKPFTTEAMLREVRAALDARVSSAPQPKRA